MKRNGLLWILMLVVLVPALALSCNKKKHHYDDEEEESIEKSEKKTDISGKYELDEESVRALFADNADLDDTHLDFRCVMTLDDDNDLRLKLIVEASDYEEDIENTINLYFELLGRGTWKYDKKEKILVTEITEADIDDYNVSFAEDNEQTDAFIAEAGGMDEIKEVMKEAFMEGFAPSEICGEQEFKITELTDDGFYARTTSGKIQKVRFIKAD